MSRICGWNFHCADQEAMQSSEIIILSIGRCLAAAYIYLQFRKLSALGSKYILGLAGFLSVFFSVVCSAGLVHLLGYELQGLGDSLPFFLLLLDLSKVSTLAQYAIAVTTQESNVKETVARGMAILGPNLTLDTAVEVLVMGIGCVSGIPMLEVNCCFGCISLIVNYIVFMTFFPGSLCLILELTRSGQSSPWPGVKKMDLDSPPNPVAQRVKLIMSGGLVLVHVYSHLANQLTSPSSLERDLLDIQQRSFAPALPLWKFYLQSFESITIQQIISYVFALLLSVKYVFWDHAETMTKSPTHIKHSPTDETPSQIGTVESVATVQQAALDNSQRASRPRRFTVGEDEEEVVLPCMLDCSVQTDEEMTIKKQKSPPASPRPSEASVVAFKKNGLSELTDEEVVDLVPKYLPMRKLEEELGDPARAVKIRRIVTAKSSSIASPDALENIPYQYYDYSRVHGQCCENVIGYVPIPTGLAGPLLLNGKEYQVPLATTEGVLVASINRGLSAIRQAGGARSFLRGDGMTRAPVVSMSDAEGVDRIIRWLEKAGFGMVKQAFDSTSRFARLESVKTAQEGRNLHLRFKARTGDAMGMNMLCKGTEMALQVLQQNFPDMQVIALSGNYCTDKKAAAINWIEGRGKSVVCDAFVPEAILQKVLKTTAQRLVQLNIKKNFGGSAMAGTIGGNNAQAANIVTAIYLATGQDAAQSIVSSNCFTNMELVEDRPGDLYVSVTMPSIEVGTVGGGTNLPAQAACLEILGLRGAHPTTPGKNAQTLAQVVAATVLAGELSLMSSLVEGSLVRSHMTHNRSKIDITRDHAVTRGQGDSLRCQLLAPPQT